MNDAAVRAKVELTVSIEPDVRGAWDELRMGQVVTNLLANAFKYAAESAVDVRLRKHGDHCMLTVRDHGPGLPGDSIERIFERFERAADPRHHGGLGLGLYVAREIVVAHGGKIVASNADGGGALFTIELPLQGEVR